MRLFICHASEDKDDFVRPLVEALKKHFDVWYDEDRLTLGDDLLRKIDEGLGSCDFGVAVLSRTFFGKKWTQAELAGLFAREGPARKIILPVWKDLTIDEIADFSPILAGRVAVLASEGVDKVVEKIRLAVEVSEKQRGLTKLEAAFEGIRKFDQTVTDRFENHRLLNSVDGATLIVKAFQTIFEICKGLAGLNQTSKHLKFQAHFQMLRPQHQEICVKAPYGLTLDFQLTGIYSNSASEAVLRAGIFHDEPQRFGGRTPAEKLKESTFRPGFLSDKSVVWTDGKKVFSNEELVGYLVELLKAQMEKQSNC